MTAIGYAIKQNDRLDITTVSPTRRAAIVNWLVTAKRILVLNTYSDETIVGMWDQERRDTDADVVRVAIMESP